MKTIFFEDSYIAGFEVTTANDVIKAQELGLHICDKIRIILMILSLK